MEDNIKKPIVIPKRVKRQRSRKSIPKNFDVQVIPAKNPVFVDEVEQVPRKRAAAYCRVSTDDEAQATSYELQVAYYTDMINSREDWVLVDIYADEGISGTQTKHRDSFNRMIEDCKAHKIDIIITKSISRFARNVVDCISTVRMLKDLSPPVSVYFEKERIDSTDEKMEVYLTMLASFAQEESRSISTNISWALRNRMKEGTQKIPTNMLLGYDTDEDYNFVIIESEAKIIRRIYSEFIKGNHPTEIAEGLNKDGIRTILDNEWSANSIKSILRNEKYCGDVLMQKTYTVSYLTHKTRKNNGEREQYFIQDHHIGIVSHEDWDKAQELLEKIAGKRKKKKPKQQRLNVIRKGRLRGFISINPKWSAVSVTRMLTAISKLPELPVEEKTENESEENVMSALEGFEVINLTESTGDSVMTVTSTLIKFNKATAVELNYPPFIRALIDAKNNRIAIQPCSAKDPNAIEFSKPEGQQVYAISIKVPALLVEFRRLFTFEEGDNKYSYSIKGVTYPEDKVIIYTIEEATKEIQKEWKRGRKKKNETSNPQDESDVKAQ